MEQGNLSQEAFQALSFSTSLSVVRSSESLEIPQARVLRCLFEISKSKSLSQLPHALRSVTPAMLSVTVIDVAESRIGSFRVVMEQVLSRAGFRSRAFTLRAFVNQETALQVMAKHWGLNATLAEIPFLSYYDDHIVEIKRDTTIARYHSGRYLPVGTTDLEFPPTFNPVILEEGGQLAMTQFEPEFLARNAVRGRPRLTWMVAPEGFHQEDVHDPVVSVLFEGQMTFPRVRYVVDPYAEPDALPLLNVTGASASAAAEVR